MTTNAIDASTTAKTSESWEDRITREQKEESDLISEFLSKMHIIGDLLEGWTFDKDQSKNCPHFVHTTGAAFCITLPGRYASRNGKVEAYGKWSRDQKGRRMSASDWGVGDAPYTIGFSYNKSAKAIASDLRRRLIPNVLQASAFILARVAEQSTLLSTINRDTAKLCRIFKTDDIRDSCYSSAKVYFKSGLARVSTHGSTENEGSRVDLTLDNLTLSQVQEIAKILK